MSIPPACSSSSGGRRAQSRPGPGKVQKKFKTLAGRYHAGIRWSADGFTLLEIMIVVGIMGIIMLTGVPIVYRAWKKAPMARAVSEVMEVCSNARAQAIMQGRQVDLVFYPLQRRFVVAGAGGQAAPARREGQAEGADSAVVSMPAATGNSGQLDESIRIEMLDINKLKHDFMLDEMARVRFFPNGTSDELTLILCSDRAERCEILLEVTTGLADVEWDPLKFR